MTRSSIELGDVTQHNITQLKKLNTFVFPVSYNIKFYVDVLEAGELAKMAYYNDIVVGAVCCRIDTSENLRRLYIMTLGCLMPYRRLGIGSVMVNHILNYAEKDGNFDSIFLHVQINNESAIDFYKKFGFAIVETKEHYYKRIEPADAYVLERNLKKNDNVTSTTAESTTAAVTIQLPNNNINNTNNNNNSNTNANINSHSHCNGIVEDDETVTSTTVESSITDQNNCNNQQQIHNNINNNHHHNHNHIHNNHSHGKSKA